MTELTNFQRMSSREIADLTNKQHKDVLRDIRYTEEPYLQVFGTERKFALSEYTDSTGRKLPEYLLTKSQTLYLVSGYSAVTRAKIQKRWEELEGESQRKLSRKELAMLVIEAEEAAEKAQKELEEAKPKIVFADAVAGSDNSILVRQFAKVLSDEGFEIGQNRLFEWLRDNRFLNKNNEPYQNYVQQGLFEVIERTVGAADQTFTTRTTKITGKGQVYFADKLRERYMK